MPLIWNKILVVTQSELVPEFYSSSNLRSHLQRNKNNHYGMKRAQRGGNGRILLIELESLPAHIQVELYFRPLTDYQTLILNLASKNKL